MPASLLPLITLLLIVGIPLAFWARRGRRDGLLAAAYCLALAGIFLLVKFIPGWILMFKVSQGSPKAQYQLAKWRENHSDEINRVLIWPFDPDVLGGFATLEKAANQDYPPALYAVGVRLKHGDHVPKPIGWSGPGGNVFPQPERGQLLIDKALALGYKPVAEEQYFYWHVYRGL